MWHVLTFLQNDLVWSIPTSMAVGLLYGYWFDAGPLKSFIIPVTFIMVYPMMVTLNVKTIFKGQDFKLQLTTQVINFVLVPLLAFYTGRLFFSGGPEKYGLWAVGLFLIGVLPTSGMTISWTGFARGNKEAAIKMVVFGLVLGALAVFYLVTYGLLSVAGRLFFKREDAIAMVFGVVMRDLSIALAIAMTAFGKQGLTIALLIALAYVIQIQTAAWYVRFDGNIFGDAHRQPSPESERFAPVQLATVTERPPRLTRENEPMVPPVRRILVQQRRSNR